MSQAFEEERAEPSEAHPSTGAAQRALEIVTNARARGSWAANQLAAQFTDGRDTDDRVAARTGDRGNGPGAGMRVLLRDAELALEGVVDALRGAMDTAGDYLASPRSVAGSIETLDISASPGRTANAAIWVHNMTSRTWPVLVPRLAVLADPDGGEFPGSVVFEPPTVSSLESRRSTSIVVSFTPVPNAQQRDYHGLVLVVGAPEVQPLYVRLSVGEQGP
jgi:hypothetical protein